jgi:hypothetical protein
MPDPDYRALCAELADHLQHRVSKENQEVPYLIRMGGYYSQSQQLIDRARAALAQPEPVAPTDEEIMELMPQQMRDDLATAARAMIGFDNPKAAGAIRIILNRHAVDHARAVLAKWGHQ